MDPNASLKFYSDVKTQISKLLNVVYLFNQKLSKPEVNNAALNYKLT